MDKLVNINTKEQADNVIASDKQGLYIKTFGCQMNAYDSEKLEKILENKYKSVASPDQADLILINTCSVRDKPEQKLYSLLGEFRELKVKNPKLLIGVGGCVAQQEGKNIVDRSRDVDFVFGTHNLSLVPGLIRQRQEGAKPQVAINYRDDWEELPLGLSDKSRISIFVAISRGCNKKCAYCIVPTTRGPEVSRSLDEILKEIKIGLHRGAKEVLLLGQTVNSYGLDLTPRLKFTDLLKQISELPVDRIRFVSPHPQEIKEDFFELIANNPKVCRHIHLPLQSGSDRILKLMNRNYRQKRYLEIVASLRSVAPDIVITTDMIVGFPGETEEDFQQTLEVMRQVRFFNTYSYMFSPRPGTEAENMPNQVEAKVSYDRLQRLQVLQDELTAAELSTWIGRTTEVLIDGPSTSDPKKLYGRNSQNILVNLLDETPTLSPGDYVSVQVEAAARYTLKGRVL
jgi:tRNA-2-methylthio-N6-dimethylallyladenosine synthase